MSISNCGHDERNKYSGGKAGDGTGGEWAVINWYNRPWKCVLRHPNADVRKMIADMARATAKNNLVGYDQSQRYTFWENLKASNYKPENITIACEADCSSGVAAIVKGVGYRMGIKELKDVSIYLYTGNMRAGLKAAGFEVLTESKYLTSDAYLVEGDIILNDSAHVATNLTTGSKAGTGGSTGGTTAAKDYLSKGDTGAAVKDMQKKLIACGYSCGSSGADGSFGNDTLAAVKKFQKENGLKVDGYFGEKSKEKLESIYSGKNNTASGGNVKVESAKSFSKALSGTYKVTASALNLRAGAGTSKKILAEMPKDAKVQCYGYYTSVSGTKWLYIVYNGIKGFASSKYLRK